MDRRREILVNPKEKATDAALREACAKWNAIVYPKIRVADVLDIENSGISAIEYTYALRAHFDFVIARLSSTIAIFAIEFDGKHHNSDHDTMRADAMKNTICAKLGMPLIRMGSDYLRRVGSFTIISWLVEIWFLYEVWQNAYKQSVVPTDEPFLFFTCLGYDPFIAYRARIQRLFELNQCQSPIADIRHEEMADGTIEATATVETLGQKKFVGKGRCQQHLFPHIPSVGPHDLSEELAIVEVAEKLRIYYQHRFPEVFRSTR